MQRSVGLSGCVKNCGTAPAETAVGLARLLSAGLVSICTWRVR